ncbi:dihydroorotase [Xanthobacter sp. KR7-225]|uniref:dihydroorotase n=1 Tax=Xanthobacter sp. KR7-225 TaxID=3156613 RepID=UPI0032B3A848
MRDPARHANGDPRPLLLANARVVDPSRGADFHGDVFLADGLVKDAAFGIAAAGTPDGAEVVDCKGAVVAPGLVDMRAFAGEPGAEPRETLASASLAAAAGGVTTLICQPDTDPVVDEPAIVDFILRRARDTAVVRVHPMAAITKGLSGEEMTEIGLLKAAGAVAFTDGHKSVASAQVLRRALTYGRDFDALIVHHTEDATMSGGAMNQGEFASRLGLSGIPKAAETIVLERDVRLVGEARARYHAAAVTCADSLAVLARAKEAGLPVTASASINHLTFNELDIGSYRTFFKVRPPLRAEEDRKALIRALASGLIDVVVSDHLPQDVEGKRLPFSEAEPGALGLETLLAAALRLVHADEVDLVNLLHALSTRPAQILGLKGGTLKSGAPADVIVFDPHLAYVLDKADLKSRSRNTPFDEARLDGRVLRTIVAGQTVYEYV